MPPYRPDRIYGTRPQASVTALVPTCNEYAMCAWGFIATPQGPKSDDEWEVLVGPAYNQGFYWLKYTNALCRFHSRASL